MNPVSDKFFREHIDSLDSITPPTNWNPQHTWSRISTRLPWYHRPMVRRIAGCVVAALLLLLWPTSTSRFPSEHSEGVALELPQKSTIDPLLTDTYKVAEKTILLPTDRSVVDAKRIVDTLPKKDLMPAPKTNELTPSLAVGQGDGSISNTTLNAVLVQKTDTLIKPETPVAVATKKYSAPIISISLHADKTTAKPVKVQRSIIKLRNDYDYTANKKMYSVQIK